MSLAKTHNFNLFSFYLFIFKYDFSFCFFFLLLLSVFVILFISYPFLPLLSNPFCTRAQNLHMFNEIYLSIDIYIYIYMYIFLNIEVKSEKLITIEVNYIFVHVFRPFFIYFVVHSVCIKIF